MGKRDRSKEKKEIPTLGEEEEHEKKKKMQQTLLPKRTTEDLTTTQLNTSFWRWSEGESNEADQDCL